jgi:hypothetical protein
MIQALESIKSYDFGTWMVGIFRSFMSGGAVALATLSGASAVGLDQKATWKMVGINFIALGLYRMGEFLQLHGAPDKIKAEEKLEAAIGSITQAKKEVTEAKQSLKDVDTEK